jgi:hypothetical protein
VKATAHAQHKAVRRSATIRIPAKAVWQFNHSLQQMSKIERDSRRRPLLAAGSGVLHGLIDDGIRPLIQIAQEVFLLDGFVMVLAA